MSESNRSTAVAMEHQVVGLPPAAQEPPMIPARTLHLVPLSESEIATWDQRIAHYADREVFHSSAWLRYLMEGQGSQIRYWAIQDANGTVGHFCGGVVRKGPFKILGSPLRGWGTNYMGPLVQGDVRMQDVLNAIDAMAREEGFAIVEMEKRGLKEELMAAAGYTVNERTTYWVRLDRDRNVMMKQMAEARRRAIRKAEKSGLVVEGTDDLSIADEFYDLFEVLMRAKGEAPMFPRTVPQALVRNMRGSGHLMALRVFDPAQTLLATGFILFDQQMAYYWGNASRLDRRDVRPNDLLHWHAMQAAADAGVQYYDLSGWGRFKRDFGGALVKTQRWHKAYSPWARWARQLYETYFLTRLRLRGWFASRASRQED